MKLIPLFLLSGFLAFGQLPVLINSAGPSVGAFQADQNFTGGAVWAPGTAGYDPSIGTGIWATLRYGTSFSYDVPVPNGIYRVVLHLVEPNKTAAGQRKFTVTANGQSTAVLDLFALTGADNVPYSIELVTLVGNGHLKIAFAASLGNAVVSAIEISQASAFGAPSPIQANEEQGAQIVATLPDGTLRSLSVGANLGIASGGLAVTLPTPTLPYIRSQIVPVPAGATSLPYSLKDPPTAGYPLLVSFQANLISVSSVQAINSPTQTGTVTVPAGTMQATFVYWTFAPQTQAAAVVDWRVCLGSYPPPAGGTPGGICDGMLFLALRKPDGSVGGNYIALPAAASVQLDPAHWQPRPVN